MIKLTDQQSNALEMVKKNNLSLLIGFPGTGKTTITREIVRWAIAEGYDIALASPTGKAAHVLSESCGYPASTIHRLLAPMPETINGRLKFVFGHDSTNPLPYSFIVVDEVSMVGNDLMSDLMQAIDSRETKVLLVGDSCQLPSVQPGNVLHDLISCGAIPVTELTEVFRHSGAIVDFCTAIRTDTHYAFPRSLDIKTGQNYVHIECGNPQVIHDTIVKLATENMVKRGYDTTRDVQILSPVNSKTVLSCDALNDSIQNIVNPQPTEARINGNGFRLMSKVINTRNIYDAISADTNDKEMILNGDMGLITDMQGESKGMIVQFENPERKIIINKYSHHLKLAYCLTIHRSQGSQFPVVIMPAHSAFQYQSNRALVYTAVSRAQEILITVGQAAAIRQAVRDMKVYRRQTFLKEKIQDRMLEGL
jgi:exodeoxyribonuclease V alpha subunit